MGMGITKLISWEWKWEWEWLDGNGREWKLHIFPFPVRGREPARQWCCSFSGNFGGQWRTLYISRYCVQVHVLFLVYESWLVTSTALQSQTGKRLMRKRYWSAVFSDLWHPFWRKLVTVGWPRYASHRGDEELFLCCSSWCRKINNYILRMSTLWVLLGCKLTAVT